MASRLYKRFAVPAATALSMTALLAGTAQALPVTQQQDATVFTIGQDGMTLNKGTSKGDLWILCGYGPGGYQGGQHKPCDVHQQ